MKPMDSRREMRDPHKRYMLTAQAVWLISALPSNSINNMIMFEEMPTHSDREGHKKKTELYGCYCYS